MLCNCRDSRVKLSTHLTDEGILFCLLLLLLLLVIVVLTLVWHIAAQHNSHTTVCLVCQPIAIASLLVARRVGVAPKNTAYVTFTANQATAHSNRKMTCAKYLSSNRHGSLSLLYGHSDMQAWRGWAHYDEDTARLAVAAAAAFLPTWLLPCCRRR